MSLGLNQIKFNCGKGIMQKNRTHTRIIKFYSKKNETILKVTNHALREYADKIEKMEDVKYYEVLKLLDITKYDFIDPIDIRKEYFKTEWLTDLVLYYKDGTICVRELVLKSYLYKRSTIEQLEFSRRYWMSIDIKDWKIILV